MVSKTNTAIPTVRSHEVLISVRAVSVNPIDIFIRNGYGKELLEIAKSLPQPTGRDCSGVVVEVGRGVKRFKIGDEVWTAVPPPRQGTFAEFCAIDEKLVAHKPINWTHIEAASLPYVALTAYSCLVKYAQVKNGQTILLHGASGGVGSVALQYLKSRDCEVVATASPANIQRVASWGANFVIDYTEPSSFASLAPRSFDTVFDAAGSSDRSLVEEQSIPLLKDGGTYVTTKGGILPHFTDSLIRGAFCAGGDYLAHKRKNRRIRYFWGLFSADGLALEEMRVLAETGRLVPNIDCVFSFAQFKEAHEYQSKKRSAGKVVMVL